MGIWVKNARNVLTVRKLTDAAPTAMPDVRGWAGSFGSCIHPFTVILHIAWVRMYIMRSLVCEICVKEDPQTENES